MPKMTVFHDHETGQVRIGPEDGSALDVNDALALVNLQPQETALFEVKHPYYAEYGNYYNDECAYEHETWADFLAEMGEEDLDYNLVYRWDWIVPDPLYYVDAEGQPYEDEPMPDESLSIFYVQQRKARLVSHEILHVKREDEPQIKAWLAVRAEHMRKVWAPLLGGQA